MRPSRTLSAPGGRRGGLARYAGATPAPTPVFEAPPKPTIPALNLGTLARVAWTIPFIAFLFYIASVVTNRFALAVFAVPIAVAGALAQGRPLRWGPLVPTMLVFLAWCALGATVSLWPDRAASALIDYAKLVLIVIAGVNALWSLNQVRVYLAVVLFCFLAYPAKGAIVNYLTWSTRQGRAAWTGVYGNPNDLAAISILVLSIALALLAFRIPKWARLATLGACGIIGFVILITQSRGAFIALALFMSAIFWRSTGRQRVRLFAGLLATVVALVAYAPQGVWQRLSSIMNFTSTQSLSTDSSAEQRFEIWKVALGVTMDHPLLGAGLGTYGKAHARVALRPGYKITASGERDTHSTYLNVLAETGPVGLVLFLTVVVTTLRQTDRVRRRAAALAPADARALMMLELGFVAYLVAGIWGSYGKLHMPYLHLLLLWTLAEAVRRDVETRGAGLVPAPGAR